MRRRLKRYHYLLAALLVLAGLIAWLQIDRHAYRSIERQCQWQIGQFGSMRGSNLAVAETTDFQRLASELAEINLLVSDTRARVKLLTDKMAGTPGNDAAMIAALKSSEQHIRSLKLDDGLVKSSGQLRNLAEDMEKQSDISQQICDAAGDAQDRRLFLEGLMTILMTAVAFYAGRKSLE